MSSIAFVSFTLWLSYCTFLKCQVSSSKITFNKMDFPKILCKYMYISALSENHDINLDIGTSLCHSALGINMEKSNTTNRITIDVCSTNCIKLIFAC